MTSVELLICAALISLSAYVSASEIAIFSLSRFQLRFLKDHFRPVYRKLKTFLNDPAGLLTTLLVVNEVINITLSALIAKIIARRHVEPPSFLAPHVPQWAYETILGIVITTPIVLLFCEITPKVVATRINQLIATFTVGPISIIYTLFKPIRFIISYAAGISTSRFRSKRTSEEESETLLKESDFLLLLEEGHREGTVEENELELVRNILALDTTKVEEIATPLSDVQTIPVNTRIQDAIQAFLENRYSRIPVTGLNNKKEIVGLLYSKDLLKYKTPSHDAGDDNASATVAEIMRKPLFVTASMGLSTLFKKFKALRTHMAIVRNPSGGVIGVVTMNDLLELIFEDLYSNGEEDEEDRPRSRKDEPRRGPS